MSRRAADVRRVAAFLDRWQWVGLILAAPFLFFPSPARTLAMLVIPGLWLAAWLAGRPPMPRTPLNGVLLLLAFMVLVSTYATYDLAVSLPKLTGMQLAFGVYFGLARLDSPHGWYRALAVWLIGGVAIAGIGLLALGSVNKIPVLGAITARLPSHLVLSVGGELQPNEVAGALLWVFPLLLVLAITMGTQRRWFAQYWGKTAARWLLFATAAGVMFTGGVLVLTQSRGGLLALGLTLIAGTLGFAVWRWKKPGLRLGIMAASLVIISTVIIGRAPLLRFLETTNAVDSQTLSLDTLSGRVELWSRAIDAIQDFPLTGMGMNTFRTVVHVLYPLFLVSPDFDVAHAHNELLQAALDLGLPGLVAFLALYLLALWMLRDIWLRAGAARVWPAAVQRALVVGLGGGLLAHFLYGLTDAIALGAKPGIVFWALLGLVVALWKLCQPGGEHERACAIEAE